MLDRTRPLSGMTCSALALGALALLAPTPGSSQVSTTLSYYVPQAGSVATPLEGTAARAFLRACPNNDGGSSLPNNARIKVVVRDLVGNPMAGIPADNICAQFGWPDSIVGGSPCDTTCIDVQCLAADAATDVNGVSYITLTGALPGAPGVGVRNPNRKWGHYDSKIPVTVNGIELEGRLTTASMNGTYVLQVKNYDIVGGLSVPCIPGDIESVDVSDLAALLFCGPGCPYAFWVDFDWSGLIALPDINQLIAHFGHSCSKPLNP